MKKKRPWYANAYVNKVWGNTICKSIEDAVQQSLEDDILVALGLEEIGRARRRLGLVGNGLFLALCCLLQLQPLDLGVLGGNILLLLVGDLKGVSQCFP